MTDDEYFQFMNCRQTKLTNRGVKVFLEWLQLQKADALAERNNMDIFSYMLRFVIQLMVTGAIKHNNQLNGKGHTLFPKNSDGDPICECHIIPLEAYKSSCREVK